METKRLGRTGLKVSVVSVGGWLTFGNAVDARATETLLRRAFELGINVVDTADVYSSGKCEETLAVALARVPRKDYVLASKVYFPTGDGPNDQGLSRKHVHESCAASLARLKTDYLDLYYCHRYDEETPLVETVRAMEDLVSAGKILYWGVSCWTSPQIREAVKLATRHPPVVNQPPYNLFKREIEKDVLATCAAEGLGVIVWSPLAEGVLSGKYLSGKQPGSRASDPRQNYFIKRYLTPEATVAVKRFAALAKDAGVSPARLALGWCLRRPEVTSVLVGATKVAQLEENAKAEPLPADLLAAVEKLAAEMPRLGD
ncbi:MAG: aldo/keto reductase family protein [Planctomycetes bacterium]|nr:aldo/keto reductase family protein [Planctomycetota bacterium]